MIPCRTTHTLKIGAAGFAETYVTTVRDCKVFRPSKTSLSFSCTTRPLQDSLVVFYHTSVLILNLQYAMCAGCISDRLVLPASSTPRQQVKSYCGLTRPFQLTSTLLQTRDGMRWLWNVVGDARGPWNLACLLGGLERGNVSPLLFQLERGTVKYISARISDSK